VARCFERVLGEELAWDDSEIDLIDRADREAAALQVRACRGAGPSVQLVAAEREELVQEIACAVSRLRSVDRDWTATIPVGCQDSVRTPRKQRFASRTPILAPTG
jgi:hypothetical protein